MACPAPWDWTLGQVDASKGPVCDSGMARAAYRLLDLATGEGKLMGLEWGTGTLTPLFLQGKLAGLVSIEHNATVAEIAARVKQVRSDWAEDLRRLHRRACMVTPTHRLWHRRMQHSWKAAGHSAPLPCQMVQSRGKPCRPTSTSSKTGNPNTRSLASLAPLP